jgi:hypothetical protein
MEQDQTEEQQALANGKAIKRKFEESSNPHISNFINIMKKSVCLFV